MRLVWEQALLFERESARASGEHRFAFTNNSENVQINKHAYWRKKTLLLLLPVSVSLILLPVLVEDEDIMHVLSVLAMTVQKQAKILRDKTSRGVPCDSTLSKIAAKFRHQVSSTFETLAISQRQIGTKIALKYQLFYTHYFEDATLARQILHWVAATKIACVNGPVSKSVTFGCFRRLSSNVGSLRNRFRPFS